MMNYIWAGMIILAFFAAIATGNMQNLSDALMSGGSDAITLCLKLLGMLCLWGGLMRIAEKSGLTKIICKILSPIIRLIFPTIDKNSPTAQAISMNMTANILGLGNAATPLGLEAMKRLSDENNHSDTASDNMIKFVLLNSASIRLIPTTVAMLRQQHGAKIPMDIMTASWVSSIIALTVGLLMVKILGSRRKRLKGGRKK